MTRARVAAYCVTVAALCAGLLVVRGAAWQGSANLHTVMEVVGTALAMIVGAVALVGYYSRRDVLYLFVGSAFLGTAFLDGYHAALTSAWFAQLILSPPDSLVPWSWMASRLFLPLALLAGCWASRGEGKAVRIKPNVVYLVTALFALASIVLCAFVSLPPALHPDWLFPRPQEFVPALFFLAALAGFWHQGNWRCDPFQRWLMLALIVNFIDEAMFMASSARLYDGMFDTAHLLKIVAYLCVLVGLLIGIYCMFIHESESAKQIARANDALRHEVGQRRLGEDALRLLNAELEARVALRTELLRQAGERMDFLLGATPAIIYSTRPDGDYAMTFISANVRTVLGYEQKSFLLDPSFWSSRIHPDDRQRVAAGLAGLETQERYIDEYRYRHENGAWRWLHDEMGLIRDGSGAPSELTGYRIDVTDRVLADEARKHAQQRLQFALDGGSLALWHADAVGNLWLSEQWAGFLGESPGETWTTIRDVVARAQHGSHNDRLLHSAVAVMNGERSEFVEELLVATATGKWYWTLWQGRVTERTADGRASHMHGTILDISHRKHAEAELQCLLERLALSNRALEQQNNLKVDFMANITHELRTPLNSVLGFAELLRAEVKGPLNPQQAVFAADILASGVQLLKLVEGILEMSRHSSGGATLERESLEVGDVLADRVAAHCKAAKARLVSISLEAADAGRADLDQKALCRVIDVMLDNAIKFNRVGGTVAVSAWQAGRWLQIAVTDTGIGIARTDWENLFIPFIQIDPDLARQYGGIGLGLALARQLTELHGGTIEVDSESGIGSTFTLRLPLQEKS
jgi:PAS domain S-box-containing protein